jgi:hypothetical protein
MTCVKYIMDLWTVTETRTPMHLSTKVFPHKMSSINLQKITNVVQIITQIAEKVRI